jgi:sugar diacid utilization regulator
MAWVVVLEPDDEDSAGALQSAPIQERVQRDLTELCRPRFPGSMVLGRVTSTVLVVPANPAAPGPTLWSPNLAEIESFARSIQEVLRGISRGVSVSIGIGNLASSAHELARAHEEARQALRLARRGGASGRVTSYRSLGALRLLLEVRDPTVVRRFVDETLGPLLEYEQHHRTPLLATLEALATNGWNQRATAKALRIHINTLTYRVQRLEALLGVALDDAELRVVLGIALQARGLQLG